MNTIKSSAVQLIKYYIGDTKIYNLTIKNSWLVADLCHCRFSIKNE